MKLSTTELAEIVTTRTCHDLIGNIGTLKNVLDFVEPDGTLDKETKKLLNDVSFLLNSRQKFFRMAFGLETFAADNNELNELCRNYVATVGTHGHTINLELRGISTKFSKLVCLCVMIASDIYIRGGTIGLEINKNNVILHAKTDYKFNEGELTGYQQILSNSKPKDNLSQYAQLLYLKDMLGEEVPMRMTASEQEMTLTIG